MTVPRRRHGVGFVAVCDRCGFEVNDERIDEHEAWCATRGASKNSDAQIRRYPVPARRERYSR